MIPSHSLSLQISKEAQQNLNTLQEQLEAYLKECRSLQKPFYLPAHLAEKFQQSLNEILATGDHWLQFFGQLHSTAEHQLLQLESDSNFLLNQFWRMAQSPTTKELLADIPHLFLANQLKNHPSTTAFKANNPLPLKILVMISSPENSAVDKLLDYEAEERQLLEAFEPLFEHGQVQIDFTDVGSLESLAEKLRDNPYHILHFSGHGTYQDGVGYLELEDHLSMNSKLVKAADFAEVLNRKPEHRPALVLLSSCLTARGTADDQLSGMTNYLLHQGIPAVVAMGWSILDSYAIQFAAELYRQIAQREPLHRAFRSALLHIREQEAEMWRKAGAADLIRPFQWLMPQLYQRQIVTHLVDWSAPMDKVKLKSFRFVSGQEKMILKRSLSAQHYFVGRRKDKRDAVPIFLKGKALLLKGQGGMGKTTMAEYLVQRMIAFNNRSVPFLFDQYATMETVLDSMSEALEDEYDDFDFQEKLEKIDKGISKFKFLLKTLKKYCFPIFVFDNLETLQSKPNKPFLDKKSDIAEIIVFLYKNQKTPLLLTCRYEVAECPDIATVNLKHVGLNDFWKKIRYLSINQLRQHLLQQQQNIHPNSENQLTYKAVVNWLYETFGGNFRALEWFDEQFQNAPKGIAASIQSLNELKEKYRTATEETLRKMTTDLAFGQLLQLLDESESDSLHLLAHFQTPVEQRALELQNQELPYEKNLQKLQSLTLVEQAQTYYYVNPLTKELLQKNSPARPPTPLFSDRQAGNYYYARYHNFHEVTMGEIEAGLQHYLKAQYAERVNELGGKVLNYYYGQSAFRKALHYAESIEAIAAESLDTEVGNRIGLIYRVFGENDKAMNLYQRNLAIQQQIGDKSGEGTTLNNLATTAHAKGDYDTALDYLKKSLAIQQQIGDKSGEGTTLNNISQIYDSRGDYDTALDYLKKSLAIRQQIGDKSGEGTTLNNLATTAHAKGDYDTALDYLKNPSPFSNKLEIKAGKERRSIISVKSMIPEVTMTPLWTTSKNPSPFSNKLEIKAGKERRSII
ncbi:MAG: CHAT domain-containing protein [Chitinophagales bacterium]